MAVAIATGSTGSLRSDPAAHPASPHAPERDASGVGMRWTTPRSASRFPQAMREAPSGSSYSPTLRSSTNW